MPRRPALRAALASGLLVVLALPGVAEAETFRHGDPAGDVERTSSRTGDMVTVPGHRSGDLVHSTMHYGTSHIRVTLRFREVPQTWTYIGRVRTPRHRFFVNADRDRRGIEADLERKGGMVPCTLHMAQDRSRETITLQVPASCVGTPRWVQIGSFLMHVGPHPMSFADVALRDGGSHASEPPFSPRIHRA